MLLQLFIRKDLGNKQSNKIGCQQLASTLIVARYVIAAAAAAA